MQEALTEGAATDARAETLPGLVAAFRFAADGSAQELTVDKPIEKEADGWLWLHFNLTDARACRFLRRRPHLSHRGARPAHRQRRAPAAQCQQ